MFAVTARLFLRPGWPEDAAALFAAINDEAIAGNLARVPWPYCLDDARAFLALPAGPGTTRWLIFSRTVASPQLVGCIGIGREDGQDAELGYWIARAHWGQGYATEAGLAVLDTARALRHRHLVASHFVDNPASGSVLRKLGFRPTGQKTWRFSRARNRHVESAEYACVIDQSQDSEVLRPQAA